MPRFTAGVFVTSTPNRTPWGGQSIAKPYTEELVYTEAEDGIVLAGLALQPTPDTVNPIAVVWIPGHTIHFYHPSFIPIGREVAALGYAFVIGNHRGHDVGAHLWRKRGDEEGMEPTLGGALWERFEESPRDVAAWGEPVVVRSSFTFALIHQDDGWRIKHVHESSLVS